MDEFGELDEIAPRVCRTCRAPVSECDCIRLNLKARNTPRNVSIHTALRDMAREEFDGDYTIALGKLLEYYEIDAKTDMLWRAIEAMEKRIADLEQKEKDKKQDDGDVF